MENEDTNCPGNNSEHQAPQQDVIEAKEGLVLGKFPDTLICRETGQRIPGLVECENGDDVAETVSDKVAGQELGAFVFVSCVLSRVCNRANPVRVHETAQKMEASEQREQKEVKNLVAFGHLLV